MAGAVIMDLVRLGACVLAMSAARCLKCSYDDDEE